jgi:hypothetical protein
MEHSITIDMVRDVLNIRHDIDELITNMERSFVVVNSPFFNVIEAVFSKYVSMFGEELQDWIEYWIWEGRGMLERHGHVDITYNYVPYSLKSESDFIDFISRIL